MYTYKFGYRSCEDSYYLEMCHETKFSKDQLVEIVADALAESFRAEIAREEQYLDKTSQEKPRHPWTSSLIEGPCNQFRISLEHKGFQGVQYQDEISVFGWGEAANPDDWKSDRAGVSREVALKLKEKVQDLIDKGLAPL